MSFLIPWHQDSVLVSHLLSGCPDLEQGPSIEKLLPSNTVKDAWQRSALLARRRLAEERFAAALSDLEKLQWKASLYHDTMTLGPPCRRCMAEERFAAALSDLAATSFLIVQCDGLWFPPPPQAQRASDVP